MAELAIGVIPLVIQLASASMECYKIFDDMSNAGDSYDSIYAPRVFDLKNGRMLGGSKKISVSSCLTLQTTNMLLPV